MSIKFSQRLSFSGLRFFKDPEISDSLPEDLCSGFLRPENFHRPQPGLNPQTYDLDGSTLPRDMMMMIIMIILIN